MTGSKGVILRVSPGLLRACKVPGREFRELGGANVLITGSRVSVAADFGMEFTDLEAFVQAGQPWIEGEYPNYARVLPDFDKVKPGFNTPVNGQYLARFAQLKPDSGKDYSGLKFWQEPSINPYSGNAILVQHDSIPEFVGIVMPIHTSDYELDASRKLFEQFPKRPIRPVPEPDADSVEASDEVAA